MISLSCRHRSQIWWRLNFISESLLVPKLHGFLDRNFPVFVGVLPGSLAGHADCLAAGGLVPLVKWLKHRSAVAAPDEDIPMGLDARAIVAAAISLVRFGSADAFLIQLPCAVAE